MRVLIFILLSFGLNAQSLDCHIAVGGLTSTSAIFASKLTSAGWYQVHYGLTTSYGTLSAVENVTANNDFTGDLLVIGLTPDTKYYYEILVNGVSSGYKGEFKTFPIGTDDLSIAYGSCSTFPDVDTWTAIGNTNAHMFAHIGDFHYKNSWDSIDQRAGFKARFVAPKYIQGVQSKMAIERIWDDHDYGPNNSSGGNPLKYSSQKVFLENSANYPMISGGEGIWRQHRVNDCAETFYLDTRFQRQASPFNNLSWNGIVTDNTVQIPNASTVDDFYNYSFIELSGSEVRRVIDYDGATQTATLDKSIGGVQLGSLFLTDRIFTSGYSTNAQTDQLGWFIRELKNSTSTWKLVFCPSSVNYGLTDTDTYTGFVPRNLELRFIEQETKDVKNIVFLTGDRHSVGLDNRARWMEVLAGPISSFLGGLQGDWTNGNYNYVRSFGLVEILNNCCTCSISVIDEDGNVYDKLSKKAVNEIN